MLECAGANEVNLRILITVFTLADSSEVIQAFRHAIYRTEYIRLYLFSAQEITIGGAVAPPRANFKARDGFDAKLAQQRAIRKLLNRRATLLIAHSCAGARAGGINHHAFGQWCQRLTQNARIDAAEFDSRPLALTGAASVGAQGCSGPFPSRPQASCPHQRSTDANVPIYFSYPQKSPRQNPGVTSSHIHGAAPWETLS